MKSGAKERVRRAEAKRLRRRKRGPRKYAPLVFEPPALLEVRDLVMNADPVDGMRQELMGLRR